MLASIQYLLSGLLVVSTKSEGGRDVFFDQEYVILVDDHPEAVGEGVKRMIERNIDPGYIHQKTIEKMETHRNTLIALVQQIYDQEGIQRNFREEWKQVYCNKLVRWQNHDETIRYIERTLNG